MVACGELPPGNEQSSTARGASSTCYAFWPTPKRRDIELLPERQV